MSLFQRRIGKLRLTWHYAAAGVIWRITPALSTFLVGETRELNKKQVGFFCLNQKTGEVMWEDQSFGEQWWIGIEALQDATLLLHKFATPDMPEHRAVIAIDVTSGKELWRNNDVKFESVVHDRIVVTRRTLTGQDRYSLDLRTGEVVPELNANYLQVEKKPEERENIPVLLFDVLSVDSPTNMLIRQHCGDRLVGPVECCELDRTLIFTHHERESSQSEQETLKTILTVLDRGNGTILFTETINRHSSVVVPENFFVERRMLFYLQDRTTLAALPLSE